MNVNSLISKANKAIYAHGKLYILIILIFALMRTFGLIGFPLSHSFSKKYFTEKFEREGITDATYELFPLPDIVQLPDLLHDNPGLLGLNVTIPHKQNIIPFLDKVDGAAARIGAVNVVKISAGGKKAGYNSDYFGFKQTLQEWFNKLHGEAGAERLDAIKAIILGTGGASKAVKAVLDDLQIASIFVSRQASDKEALIYEQLTKDILDKYRLIINTTPLGMSPNIAAFPPIPYPYLNASHYLYDLVYNPDETVFMQKGKERGAQVLNGLPMLYAQAEKSWEIWNS